VKQNERNFWLDCSLFIVFLSTMFTGLLLWLPNPHQTSTVILGFTRETCRSIHICSGLAIAVGNVIHLIWHRDWLKALRKRPMGCLPLNFRTNRVLDRFIWMIFLAASGFGALDWILSMGKSSMSISGRLHVAFGMVWLLGIVMHLALHKKWITYAIMRYLRVKDAYGAHLSNI
jgi:hypothetical protein